MKQLFLFLITLILAVAVKAQNISGDWKGKLTVGSKSVDIIFHIFKNNSGSYNTTLDVPIQKAYNVSCNETILNGDSIIIVCKSAAMKFEAQIREAGQISGNWLQGGLIIPTKLNKNSDVAVIKKFIRPQTPIPPFSYKSEEIEYDNTDKSIHFGGTFTVPLSGGKTGSDGSTIYPTVLLITGSGKQDRDETIYEHKSFAVIADYLTQHGIAVLRVDDREMGKTSGNFMTSTTLDFANDVEAGIDYLKTRKDVDVTNIGLLGHSEGGVIAPMVASRRKDVKFIVLLAAPGVSSTELLEKQSIDLLAAQGVPLQNLEEMRPMMHDLTNAILNAPDTAIARKDAMTVFTDWESKHSRGIVRSTTGVVDEISRNSYVNRMVLTLNLPWYRYFMKMNPADFLFAVRCNVLALNGEKDIQVDPKTNLDAIKLIMDKNNSNKTTIIEMPGLNHLFQHCKKCTFGEYSDLDETFAPEALEIIGKWIIKTIS